MTCGWPPAGWSTRSSTRGGSRRSPPRRAVRKRSPSRSTWTPPAPPSPPSAASGTPTPPTGRSLGRSLWGVGRATGLGGLELSRQFLGTGDALLNAHFTDERLKTALAWLGAQSGPPMWETATADLVGWNALMHRVAPARPKGGSGMLTAALANRLSSYGGSLRTGDGAARITTDDQGVSGVGTYSGEHLAARTVVAYQP